MDLSLWGYKGAVDRTEMDCHTANYCCIICSIRVYKGRRKENHQKIVKVVRFECAYTFRSTSGALSEHMVWAEDCPPIWHELIFHPARSEGLAGTFSLFSTEPGNWQCLPHGFGNELNY